MLIMFHLKKNKNKDFEVLPSKFYPWAIQKAADLKKIKNQNINNVLFKKNKIKDFEVLLLKFHLWAIQEAVNLKKWKMKILITFHKKK